MGPRRCVTDRLLAKADVTRAVRERVQLCKCVRTHRQNLPSSVRTLASAETITSSECMVATCWMTDKLPQSLELSLERLFPGCRIRFRPLRYWIPKVSGYCPPSTLGSSHSSQTVDSRHDSRRSHSWPSAARTISLHATGHFS